MYVRLVKCQPAKEAGDFSNQPAFFQIYRLKAGSRLPWKALKSVQRPSARPIPNNSHTPLTLSLVARAAQNPFAPR